MNKTGIRPDDILADDQNFVNLNGVMVRKGSIAAFLKNIDILEDARSSEEVKEGALAMLKELAPGVIASGLHRHATFQNKCVREIIEKELAKKNPS